MIFKNSIQIVPYILVAFKKIYYEFEQSHMQVTFLFLLVCHILAYLITAEHRGSNNAYHHIISLPCFWWGQPSNWQMHWKHTPHQMPISTARTKGRNIYHFRYRTAFKLKFALPRMASPVHKKQQLCEQWE